ncbi:MAG: epoxyqueuosine reductase QueH [Ruminococcaceae bacterium]|nr:epoxyqueuosine reductase QueH [Oscillospiraceae bacterium]
MSEIKRNYQRELDKLIENNQRAGVTPTLCLHACCAPCMSYCLEYLSNFFKIIVVFYNPNITEEAEYNMRLNEVKRFVAENEYKYPVTVVEGDYTPEKFFELSKGLESAPERGKRCLSCYEERLRFTAKLAKEMGADFFATTLTLSPLKNADAINKIGERLSAELDTPYLCTDFKKKGGYLRSIELSKLHNLYRQNFCGCIYSR